MLTLLSALILGGRAIKEASEPKLPACTHGNWRLEAADIEKVRRGEMTQREFNKNMENGKYYEDIYSPNPNDRYWEIKERLIKNGMMREDQ